MIMTRNKKKIIRACTVSLSIDFFDEIMIQREKKVLELVKIHLGR